MNSGIYKITCLANKRFYIGSSIDLSKRLSRHRRELNKECHINRHLQRAWNKYGADAFVFEILLYCDPENCLMYEQIALDYYKPKFNIATSTSAVMSGRKHTEETKIKIKNNRPNHNGSNNPMFGKRGPNLGKKFSAAHCKKIRQNHARLSGNSHYRFIDSNIREQIVKLRSDGVGAKILAKRFGISKSSVYNIEKENNG